MIIGVRSVREAKHHKKENFRIVMKLIKLSKRIKALFLISDEAETFRNIRKLN